VDGLLVTFMNGQYSTVGSPDAVRGGVLIDDLEIQVGDTVKEIYLWTDSSAAAVQGIYITMASSATLRLAANLGRSLAQPNLKMSGAQLGSGILLGLAAATRPGSMALAAVSFNFLSMPASVAIAFDMPAIDLEKVQQEPQQQVQSSVSVTGGSGGSTCPEFSTTVTRKTVYAQPTSAQKYRQLMNGLGTPSSSATRLLAATLQWSGVQTLPSGGKLADNWNGQVVSAYDAAAVTPEAGVSVTVSAPRVSFTVPSGQSAKCVFAFSTIQLTIPYTCTATLMYDAYGNSSWATSMQVCCSAGRFASTGVGHLFSCASCYCTV
jgi:hypothetical protein